MIPLILSSILLTQGAPVPQEKKAPVPSAADAREAEKLIRNLFRQEYVKRDLESRQALARNLLAQAKETNDDPVARYVLLKESSEIAASTGDFDTAFAAIDQMAALFEIDATSMKEDTLRNARNSVRTLEGLAAMARTYLRLAETALENEEFDAALRMAREASTVGRRARDKEVATSASELSKSIPARKREHEEAGKARLLLTLNPDDPKANLTLGRFLCLVKGNWEKGLPMLANGADAKLKSAAEKELAKPEGAEAQAEVGGAWWTASQAERDALRKGRLAGRAQYWYERALPGLGALAKLRAEKRLEEMSKTPHMRSGKRSTIDLMPWIDAAKGTVGSEAKWELRDNKLVSPMHGGVRHIWLMIPCLPPGEYDIGMAVERQSSAAAGFYIGLVYAGHRFAVMLDEEGRYSSFGLFGGVDGRELEQQVPSGKVVHREPVLHPRTPVTIVCSVRRTHLQVTANGETILQMRNPNYRAASLASFIEIPREPSLFLGVRDLCHFNVSQIQLMSLSGFPRRLTYSER